MIGDCELATDNYELSPTYFAGDVVEEEEMLEIRIQHGSDQSGYSDGIVLLVQGLSQVAREQLGAPINLAAEDSPVRMSFFLNESCRPERRSLPVNLEAQSGTVAFDAIYAPKVSEEDVEITGRFEEVEFRDRDKPEARWAILSGEFDFLYNRGRPAQRFP